MLEESIPPTSHNKILLMLELKIIPEVVIKENPQTKNPTPPMCNLPFASSPKAMTHSASQVAHSSSTLVNSFPYER